MSVMKTTLQKKINGIINDLYPKTSADQVEYDSNTTVEQKIKQLESNSGSGGTGTSEKFDRSDLTAVTVGGLNAGSSVKDKTVKDVLENILFPYQKPVVSFTISPNTTIYEIGNTVSAIDFSVTATKKSENIQSIKIYDGYTLLTTITTNVSNGGTFNYSYTCSISSNTTLKVEVSDGTSTVSSTKNIVFANRSYYGFIANGASVNADAIKALQNSVVKTSKGLTYDRISCIDSKLVYAYPKSQGLLSSIKDGNGFEYINSYICTTIAINGVDYNAYVLKDATTVSSFKQVYA